MSSAGPRWLLRSGAWITQSAICCRRFQSSSRPSEFGFAFDIDGVLLRGSDPIPQARDALLKLQAQRVPFILLTNGGGKLEADRVAELSARLRFPLEIDGFIQSHSPFAELDQFKSKTILAIGGDEDRCRHVAESYGFQTVVTPGDILLQHPEIWPFSKPFATYYLPYARPLPRPIDPTDPANSLKIDAIFVFNDPRDWGLDATVIMDLVLSKDGVFGTLSSKNGDPSLPNRGYQQDGQPPLYFSNPDLWWAAEFVLPRLGQGGFREALQGIWVASTGGRTSGAELQLTHIGKPHALTYEFAEKKLLSVAGADASLKRIFMIGDNPESDIRGGNTFKSPSGIEWSTILVKTGIYQGGEPSCVPTHIAKDVYEAINWAFKQEHA